MPVERVPYIPPHPPQHAGANNFIPKFLYKDPNDTNPIKIRDDFYGTRRQLRVGILGAGMTCIQFLHCLEISDIPRESIEVVVFEREADVGGVWLTSRYPGCRSDLDSISFQFSWRPNIWSEFRPLAEETWEYIRTVAQENDFYRYIRFHHEIVQAEWKDEEAKWTLKLKDCSNESSGIELTEKVDVFLDFGGPVKTPLVTVPGLQDFGGPVIHPSRWDESIDLKGKNVALVGYGSSGMQLAPSIINKVSKLYTWYRGRFYVSPPPPSPLSRPDGLNFRYTDEQKSILQDPDLYLTVRKTFDSLPVWRGGGLVNGNPVSAEAGRRTKEFMRIQLENKPEVFDRLVPVDFDLWCRRPTSSLSYLQAINSPKTVVLSEPPIIFTKNGVIDAEGKEHPLDVVIAATGYDQTHLPRFPVVVNGANMRSKHSELEYTPCYMSLLWEGMPNYFCSSSAFTPVQWGSWFKLTEFQAQYILKVLSKMQTDLVASVRPKPRRVQQWARHADAFFQRTVLTGPCRSWFKAHKDGSPTLWPGGRSTFLAMMEHPRWEDFEIEYEDPDDDFAFLANGFTLRDGMEEGKTDHSYYMGKPGREVKPEEWERLKGIYADPVP